MTPVPQPPPLRRPRSGAQRFWIAMSVFACLLAVAIALLYAEEDWRGGRAWAAVQTDLQAKRETLDWRRFVLPPVPDDRNLAMAPLFVRELSYEVDPKTHTYTFGAASRRPKDLDHMPMGDDQHALIKTASYETGRPPDLSAYQQFYRQQAAFPHAAQAGIPAVDVLLALTRYSPALDELARGAAECPFTRFPLDWNREEFWSLSLPHYNLEQKLVRTLCLRSSAQQALGDTAAAVRDLELALRLCRDAGAERILIGHLVEITCLSMILNEVWERLATRRWSTQDLARLQADLGAFDLLADFAESMRCERAITVHNIDYLKRNHDPGILLLTGYSGTTFDAYTKRAVGFLVPGGWFDANKAVVSRFEQDYAVETVDAAAHRVFVARALAGKPELEAMRGTIRLNLSRTMLAIFDSITSRSARSQTALDEAVTACALERFFFEHQAYPTRLDALVPAFLERVPNDVIDGAPLRYRLTSDGRYLLYGIGWDGQDDGGRVEWSSNARLDPNRGDWVWQYTELHNPHPVK